MHHPLRRTLPALAALGIALAAPLATAGTAQASIQGSHCEDLGIEFSTDNGAHWATDGRMSAPHGKIMVKLDGETGAGCDYQVSLASYSAEGPTWQTSGTQVFLGWATATLNKAKPQATLDISAHLPKCFGQIDLYSGNVKHDGVTAPAPKYPSGAFNDDLITAWNGGTACTPTTSPSPSAPVSPSASATVPPTGAPTPPVTGTPTPSASVSASASPSPSTSASASASATPSGPARPSTSAAAPAPTTAVPTSSAATTAEPVGKPSVKPVSTTPTTASLASTGSNGGEMIAVATGGAALLALGAGAVVFTRRRSARG